MTIRKNSGKLPWSAGGGGVYGPPRGSAARPAVLAAIVLGVLAVLTFVFVQACMGGGCDDPYCASDRDLAAPEGFERVSKVFEYDRNRGELAEGARLLVSMPLTRESAGANVSIYRYVEDTKAWEPVASAEVDAGGKHATATLTEAPSTIAVFRRLSPAGHVVAYLPKGQSLHEDAAGKVTLVHTLDFTPSAEGGISGDATVMQGTTKFEVYPVISASAADKTDAIVSGILSSAESRSNHVQQIAAKAREANLKGIDVAYMDLKPDQRFSFAVLVAELAGVLHKENRKLTVMLPPPILANDRIDEGAYDWGAIGAAADLVEIAPFRDQSRYRLDMPSILDHLTSVVDRQKLILTVTPYATESSSDGTTTTMSLTKAMAIATQLSISGVDSKLTTESNVDVVGVNIDRSENLTGLVWDPNTATVAFTYKFNTNRTVWIENFFSVGFKLEYISEYRLGGVAVEDASSNDYLGNIWTAVAPYISSGQPVLMQPHPKDLAPEWWVSGGQKEGGERAGQNGVLRWFTPSEAGTYVVKLLLSDGVAQFESQISVNILPRERTPAPEASATASR